MPAQTYQCAAGRFIHCYAATQASVFIAESSLEEPWRVQLQYLHQGKPTTLQYPIQLRRSTPEQGSAARVKNLFIASIPHFNAKSTIDPWFYLIFHMGDGIQICSLRELIKGNCIDIHKWVHPNGKDVITSCFAQGSKDQRIVVTYSTLTGQLVRFAFDVQRETFTKLPLLGSLLQTQDRIMDHLNNIAGLRSDNYPLDVQEQLWVHPSDLALSCLDNTLYAIVEGKLECQPFYDLQDDNLCIWTDLAVAKQYSNSSLRFFVVNVTNVGCVLYRRSNRGQWEFLQTLHRAKGMKEKSPLVDCLITLLQRHTLRILSGSEDGKLYQWDYDYVNRAVVNEEIFDVSGDVVHSLSVVKDKAFFLNNSNTSINYVELS